jgi:hypothetical protein
MAVKKGSEEHRRQQEMHGWAFRDLTEEQEQQVRDYLDLKTDEVPDLTRKTST